MRERSRYALAITLLTLALPPGLLAQDWAGGERAQGIVVDATDAPIQGATVTLRYELSPENGPKPLTTNKKGRWSVIGLKPGPWLIEVAAEGYIPRKAQFTVYDTGANETVKIDLAEVPAEVKEAARRTEANALLARGNELVGQERFAEARAEYEQVLTLLPEAEHAPILAGIASSYFKEDDAAKGNEVLARALAVDPDDASALRLKIAALAAEGKEEEAREYQARLPAEAELDPNAELNLGVMRYNDGDMEAAAAIFEKVRDAHPEIADAHYYCGLVYLARPDNPAALTAFREVLRLEPGYAKAEEIRGFIDYLEQAVSE